MGIGITSFATGRVKKVIEGHAKKYEPEDPYYEFYTDAANPTVQKRRKRAPPPGLTKQQAKLLRKIARRAHYLDKGFYVCGFRFGWTFIFGLVPGLGDAVNAALNYTLVVRPSKNNSSVDLPDWLVRNMLFNNAVSVGVGLVPFAGDVFVAVWKTNSRNAKLLEEYLRILGEEQISKGLPNLTPTPPNAHPAQDAARALISESQQTTEAAASAPATADAGAAATQRRT